MSKPNMKAMGKQWDKMAGNMKAKKVHKSSVKSAAKKSGF